MMLWTEWCGWCAPLRATCGRQRTLLWMCMALVRFVAVHHPTRGKLILMTTDLSLAPLDVIRLYGDRFKSEVSFKSTCPGVVHLEGPVVA